MTPDVVVCGAGVGGLACARALGALGLSVLVLDRQRRSAGVAKGELLQPDAVRILDGWGALPALEKSGAVAVGRLTMRDPAGRALLGLDYATLPGAYRQVLCTEYPTVLRALAEGLGPSVEVRRGVLVKEALRDGDGRVRGVRVAGDGGGHDVPARLVVAADGISSALRKAAGIPVQRRPYDHRLVAFDLPDAPVDEEICAYQTDQGLRLVYPLPGGRCRLYAQVGPEELRGGAAADLSGWSERLLRDLPPLAPLAEPLRHALAGRQLLAVYRSRTPRLAAPGLALAGEAAHAVHPMAAQGMNSSLADAEALAERVAAEGELDDPAVDRALRGYQDARAGRLDHIATVSHNAARMLTTTAGPARLLGRRLMRHTAANPRLLRITTGNLAGVGVRPLTAIDRLHQLGLLPDRHAHEGEPR